MPVAYIQLQGVYEGFQLVLLQPWVNSELRLQSDGEQAAAAHCCHHLGAGTTQTLSKMQSNFLTSPNLQVFFGL